MGTKKTSDEELCFPRKFCRKSDGSTSEQELKHPLISSKGEEEVHKNHNTHKHHSTTMDNNEHGGGKVTGIRQIVRLKELLQKWQNVTLSPKSNDTPHRHGRSHSHPGGISPSVNRRLKSTAVACDSDEESCHSPEPPPDVPKGFLAVYVGKEVPLRRFIIPTSNLSHHVFKVLLEKAEEEYGFEHGGGLTIPCEVETFKYLIKCIENENQEKEENSDVTVGESSSSCPED